MISYEKVKSVHLEISTRCNASCPDCLRNFRGVNNVLDTYPVLDMSLEQFKSIFDQEFLTQLNDININGNHGDFVTAQDGLAIVKYIKQINPNIVIRISTNASAKPDIWEELGQLGVTVNFRIDGLKDTHHLYRINTDYDLILANAKKFISTGGVAIWSMILFDHNKSQINSARLLAKELGFSDFELVNAGRNTFPVFFQNRTLSHTVGNYHGSTDFDKLHQQSLYYKDSPNYESSIDHTSRKIACHSKIHQQIYVSANGEVYPCCWLGFYPKLSDCQPSNIQIKPMLAYNNALEHGLRKSIEWFDEIEQTWKYASPSQGRVYACNNACGK